MSTDRNDNLNLSPEESERLKELREALESEFHTNNSAGKRPSPIEDLVELKQDFLAAIKHVVRHSTDDKLRARVAMWGYDKMLDEARSLEAGDPLTKLVKEMAAIREKAQAE